MFMSGLKSSILTVIVRVLLSNFRNNAYLIIIILAHACFKIKSIFCDPTPMILARYQTKQI